MYPLPSLHSDHDSTAPAPSKGFSAQAGAASHNTAHVLKGRSRTSPDGSAGAAAAYPDRQISAESNAIDQPGAVPNSKQSTVELTPAEADFSEESVALSQTPAAELAEHMGSERHRTAGQPAAHPGRDDTAMVPAPPASEDCASAFAAQEPASVGGSVAEADGQTSASADTATVASPFVQQRQELAAAHTQQVAHSAASAETLPATTGEQESGASPLHEGTAARQAPGSQLSASTAPGPCGAARCTCDATQPSKALGASDASSDVGPQPGHAIPQAGASLRRPSALRRGSALAAAAAQGPATKRYSVRVAPPMLTAHLKRFEQVSLGWTGVIGNLGVWVEDTESLKEKTSDHGQHGEHASAT